MFSLDEAFLDLSDFENPIKIAKEIKEKIKKETGLTASVGVAPNKLLAKIASDLDKPDGFTVIPKEDVEKILDKLPVRKLWGVGKKTEEKLKKMGIETVKQLKEVPIQRLLREFGKAWGYMLYKYARGIDDSEVVCYRERKSLSREITFQEDIEDKKKLQKVLKNIAQEISERLYRDRIGARTVTLKIRFEDFQTITKSYTFERGLTTYEEIINVAVFLLDRVKIKKKIRLLGIRLSNLVRFFK